jgi:hypothetical protein
MTDIPLRGSVGPVTPVGLPYGPSPAATSASDRRTRLILFVVWLALLVAGLVYVGRYALTNPYVDEWAFIPVLFGDKPAGPWLWELHNEHRFPLPRLIYLALFQLTGDLRTGCYVSLVGISLVAAWLMRLARKLRGRSSVTDAVFPLLLMHVGQGENLYMGYQLAFMLTATIAAGLLAVVVWNQEPTFQRALLAQLLGALLLTCGAAGLAFGVAAAGWVLYLAAFGRFTRPQRLVLGALTLLTPAYIVQYFQGYVRPSHHPESAGVIESLRIGLEAQAMALGPPAVGVWQAVGDVTGVVIFAVGLIVVGQLLGRSFRCDARAVGLALFVAAAGAVAFGIGWGRSGFHSDMGFAWRYGWVTAPAVWAAYFTWLVWGGRVSVYGPAVLAIVAVVLFPISEASGFLDAERKVRTSQEAWESDVRAGLSGDQLVDRHFPNAGPEYRRHVQEAVRRMRERGYTYYEPLAPEKP